MADTSLASLASSQIVNLPHAAPRAARSDDGPEGAHAGAARRRGGRLRRINAGDAGAGAGGRRGGGGFAQPAKKALANIADPRKKAAAIMRLQAGAGHAFSASNPYGKRDAADARQFAR